MRKKLRIRTVISIIHDGLTFYFTLEAFYSDREEIGFYFDLLGYPQRICRNSIYGKHIERYIEEMYDEFKH